MQTRRTSSHGLYYCSLIMRDWIDLYLTFMQNFSPTWVVWVWRKRQSEKNKSEPKIHEFCFFKQKNVQYSELILTAVTFKLMMLLIRWNDLMPKEFPYSVWWLYNSTRFALDTVIHNKEQNIFNFYIQNLLKYLNLKKIQNNVLSYENADSST